jgi:hypothetical protein
VLAIVLTQQNLGPCHKNSTASPVDRCRSPEACSVPKQMSYLIMLPTQRNQQLRSGVDRWDQPWQASPSWSMLKMCPRMPTDASVTSNNSYDPHPIHSRQALAWSVLKMCLRMPSEASVTANTWKWRTYRGVMVVRPPPGGPMAAKNWTSCRSTAHRKGAASPSCSPTVHRRGAGSKLAHPAA